MKTKIIIVRHAECFGNIENKLSGITDFELTLTGMVQIKKLASRLEDEKIEKIYSSPLKRAKKTANGIAEKLNITNIIENENLIEINYGECDGMTWEEIDDKYPKIRGEWKEKNHYPIGIPGQEPYADLQKRITNEIIKLANENLGKTICIVSHGIAIGSFMCYVHGLPFEKVNEIPAISNTGVNILEYENGEFKIIIEADDSHL
ncbi:MAG: histidine phosphatase family protein [Clostridia bacterium]|nr:histidine phosphatase family protein [Clostridia bacterium]